MDEKSYNLANFSQKLDEIERIWTRGTFLAPPLDLPIIVVGGTYKIATGANFVYDRKPRIKSYYGVVIASNRPGSVQNIGPLDPHVYPTGLG